QCEATMIPSGEKHSLPAGSQVWITQSLGGGFTVTTDRGHMVHIAAKDADALGMVAPEIRAKDSSKVTKSPLEVESKVWDQLKSCFDPEIPVNIVELGLIYHCEVLPSTKGGNKVEVKFTLTAQGCGMGEVLKEDIRHKVMSVPGVSEVDVELVWDPPWDQSMISGAAKQRLGML
ncbi:MAG: putative Fe-S cluster assembly protein SufT, partial [Deltaproteobacteria bacterium]|nr:putative Fe-S cluster assembly protein SufT [Deltaproteobacteria bacterium]